MAEFYALGISCVHCGGALSARRDFSGTFSIKGLHRLVYIHTATGAAFCTVRREARPHDGWQASAAYDAAYEEASK